MNASKRLLGIAVLGAALATAGCAGHHAMQHGARLSLSGSHEVPSVSTMASGTGSITVDKDRSVSGSIKTAGVDGKAAHIHEGAAGANGPVIVPLTRTDENTWSVPPGAKLNEAQYASYQAGNLYVNVHSAAYPGGEIRGQLKPK